MRAAITLPFVLLQIGCAYPMDTEPPAYPADPHGCPWRGGHIERRGMFGDRVCVTPYPDAGRACTDSSQCAGRCLLSYGSPEVTIQSHPIGREAAGQCEADSPTFGCYGEIVQGRITRPVCDD
jgi:hypothetical protein